MFKEKFNTESVTEVNSTFQEFQNTSNLSTSSNAFVPQTSSSLFINKNEMSFEKNSSLHNTMIVESSKEELSSI